MTTLEAQGIRKVYGGTTALAGIDFSVEKGSVHALLGENGAGKSTLVKILTGAVSPTGGTLRLGGDLIQFRNAGDAASHGIAVVAQELNVFPDTDILTNLFPLTGPTRFGMMNTRRMRSIAEPILAELGLDVPLNTLVGELTLAGRQQVEIARALVQNPSVLVLDEPTSALEADSGERLLGILRALRDRGVAVVFVSHILEEVMALSDRITVLRDGKVVIAGDPIADHSVEAIISAMLGSAQVHEFATGAARPHRTVPLSEDGALVLTGIVVPGQLNDVTFTARRGEVVGLAGLAGSGHTAVLEVASGRLKPTAGVGTLPDTQPLPKKFREAVERGVAFVTGDRKRYGLMLEVPIWENVGQVEDIALARGGMIVQVKAIRAKTQGYIKSLSIRTTSPDLATNSLSGGNQQKVVFAKWLAANPTVMLLDDPTRGVDVGAKAEMHTMIRDLSDSRAVVFCSTDNLELVNVCDRVLVFFRGGICAELHGDGLTADSILLAMNTGSAESSAVETAVLK